MANRAARQPAFPRPGYYPDDTAERMDHHERNALHTDPQEGMTLREYFAAKALAGLLAAEAAGGGNGTGAIDGTPRGPELVRPAAAFARLAVELADALIDALHPAPVVTAADED